MILLLISAEWASVWVNLFTGVIIAFLLAYVVPQKLTNNRTLKDFYIDEIRSIKSDYNSLCKNICLGNCSASDIKEHFKQLNIKLIDIQYSINNTFPINVQLIKYILNTQFYVTNTEEINEQFKKKNVIFNQKTKLKILEMQDIFNRNMLSAIIAINKG